MSVGFNEPGAWGYCMYCAFQVATDQDTGQMFVHARLKKWVSERCYGSLLEPTEQPGPEAEPVSYEDVIADAIRVE